MNEVLLILTDDWADWEASYAIVEINRSDKYRIKTVAVDKNPKVSIGGIRAEIDEMISEDLPLDDVSMLILPGGFSWSENRYDVIAALVRRAAAAEIPVAAICGGAVFLGKHGFLDKVKHNGDTLEYFLQQKEYHAQDNYVAKQVVSDGGFITANETAALEFAYEIFKALKMDDDAAIDSWYDTYKNGMMR